MPKMFPNYFITNFCLKIQQYFEKISQILILFFIEINTVLKMLNMKEIVQLE